MILGNFRLLALGALLVGASAPSLAEAPHAAAVTVDAAPQSMASARDESREASHSRRVELPFPLEFRSPERQPPAPTRQADSGPHPFRETLFKRASWTAPVGTRGLRLSRLGDFS